MMILSYLRFLAVTFAVLLALPVSAQISMTNTSNLLAIDTLRSGVAMGIADVDCDGYDDIIRLNMADTLYIEYQQPDGSFIAKNLGVIAGDTREEWALAAADVDRNGYLDIITGGNRNGQKLYTADAQGDTYSIEILPFQIPGNLFSRIYTQGVNFADINNDGWLDYFACNDIGINSVYRNDDGELLYDTSLINTIPSPLGGGSGNEQYSGNYGTTWSDYDWDGDIDLYISKCRLGVSDATDSRRINQLLNNDGTGEYSDSTESANLKPLAQSWSSSFADFDNDGDMDCFIINHDSLSQFKWNDGSGHFDDITVESGVNSELNTMGTGIQVILEDFDNDGFVDVFLTTSFGNWEMFRNNGDSTFSSQNFGIDLEFGERGPQSAAAGDLNHDGFVDLMLGFAFGFNQVTPPAPFFSVQYDQLQLNNGNSNHFLNTALVGTTSNIHGIGARIEAYGSWGVQIREVRAGESYGIQNSMARNFGLGTATIVDSLIVRWPSGTKDKYENVAADQFLKLVEGCSGPPSVRTVMNKDNSGIGSLRTTIANACPLDTINFDGNLSMDTIKLTDGEIILDKSLVISGINEAETLISGNNSSRIFSVISGVDVTIQNLALIEAAGTTPDGGAILNEGNLAVKNLRFAGNMKDGVPSAIENKGTLTVEESAVIIEE